MNWLDEREKITPLNAIEKSFVFPHTRKIFNILQIFNFHNFSLYIFITKICINSTVEITEKIYKFGGKDGKYLFTGKISEN